MIVDIPAHQTLLIYMHCIYIIAASAYSLAIAIKVHSMHTINLPQASATSSDKKSE